MSDKIDRLATAIADRLAPLLLERLDGDDHRLLTAAEVAERLGRRPEWVRAHASELGAVRLTDGPRPRLWFRAEEIERRRDGG